MAFQGELRPFLEKLRTQEREVRFQGVQTVSLEQAYALHREGKAMFVDARPPDEYAELHISGAVNLPPDDLEKGPESRLAGSAKDRDLVVYCGQANCDAALEGGREAPNPWGTPGWRPFWGASGSGMKPATPWTPVNRPNYGKRDKGE